jgi:hypothetical protein
LLDNQIRNLGHEIHSLHTGPIIRREKNYKNLSVDERKKLLRNCPQITFPIGENMIYFSPKKSEVEKYDAATHNSTTSAFE